MEGAARMTVDVLTVGSIAAALTALIALSMAVRKLLTGALQKDIDAIRAELRPNSGSSLRDAVDLVVERQSTIGRELRDLKAEVRELRTKTDDHIMWHLDVKE
jgi:hypothetical protein